MYPIKKLQDCATIIAGQSPESKYYNTTGEGIRSEEHTSELQSPYVNTYAVFCLKKKTKRTAP